MSLTENETNARMSPVSDPQIHRPKSVAQRGLPHQEWMWPKRQAQQLRFGTLNVGSMTGRGRAIADLMKERKMDVLCVQETRWTGNKAKELGDGFKLIYGGATKEKRNGIGIILSKDVKDLVRWYGHLRRRVGEDHVGREVMELEVQGNRKRGRPKRRWIDSINVDLREKNLNPEIANNRNAWRRLLHNGDPE